MHEKHFDGQYSNEQILLERHEHPIAFILSHLSSFASVVVIGVLLSCVVYFLADSLWVGVGVMGFLVISYIAHSIHHYHKTVFYITSRRIILFTTRGVWGHQRREIRLENILGIRVIREDLFAKIFRYGDLIFSQGGEEFRVNGLSLHDEIRSYIGRLIEYIKSHGYPEQFTAFLSRKERRALKLQGEDQLDAPK